jgi:nucleoside-diphosphate-sugar epimerase
MPMRERDGVVVFGGATIFGSRLVERLVERRLRVIAVDDLESGSIENLARALDGGGATLAYARDLGDIDIVRAALAEAECHDIGVVHHCADPSTLRVSLEIANELAARSIVAIHRGEVAPPHEAAEPTCLALIHGLYGPRVFEAPALGSMFGAALQRLPIRARPGAVMPPLTFIDDAVDAMLVAMDRSQRGVFDVAAARDVLEEDVARSLATMCGVNVAIESDAAGPRASNWLPRFPEPSGWVPRVSLHDGLRRTWRALAEASAW